MSFTGFALVVVLVWLAVGTATALVLGRRGHDSFQWGLLGAVLGPLVVPIALKATRAERPLASVITTGTAGFGSVDVLVGLDGSPESQGAVAAVAELLKDRIGRLRLVHVLAFDSGSSPSGREQHVEAEKLLARQVTDVEASVGHKPDCVLLAGEPSRALRQHAVSEGFDLIVVGSRGRGASHALLGSVATRLAGLDGIPVLIVPPPAAGLVEKIAPAQSTVGVTTVLATPLKQ